MLLAAPTCIWRRKITRVRAIFSSRGGTHFYRSRGRPEKVHTRTGWSSSLCEISDNRTDRLTCIRGSQDIQLLSASWKTSRKNYSRETAIGLSCRSRVAFHCPSLALSSRDSGFPLASKGSLASRISLLWGWVTFLGETHLRLMLRRVSQERRIWRRRMSRSTSLDKALLVDLVSFFLSFYAYLREKLHEGDLHRVLFPRRILTVDFRLHGRKSLHRSVELTQFARINYSEVVFSYILVYFYNVISDVAKDVSKQRRNRVWIITSSSSFSRSHCSFSIASLRKQSNNFVHGHNDGEANVRI